MLSKLDCLLVKNADEKGGDGQYPHSPARMRCAYYVYSFFHNLGNKLGQSMAARVLINVMRRKTKPKLVLLIRCRREKCKNILHRLRIKR